MHKWIIKIHSVSWKTGFMCLFPVILRRSVKPSTPTNYPGILSTKKFLQITGYPGNRYSALDTTLVLTLHITCAKMVGRPWSREHARRQRTERLLVWIKLTINWIKSKHCLLLHLLDEQNLRKIIFWKLKLGNYNLWCTKWRIART